MIEHENGFLISEMVLMYVEEYVFKNKVND